VLDRRGIDGCAAEWLSDPFDPDSSNDLDVVQLYKAQQIIEELVSVAALSVGSATGSCPDFAAFDFRKNPVQKAGGRCQFIWEKPLLQVEKIEGQSIELRFLDEDSGDYKHRLDRRRGSWQSAGTA
jgi:hypothetical protein